MAELFRKTSLEKLSSPEQLDRAIVITPPSFWIALAGGFVIVVGVLIWAVFGKIPVNVDTQGIYLSGDGTRSVYGEVNGIVTEIQVKQGEQIKEGDVVAVVGGGEISNQIEKLGKRMEDVQRVTLNSTSDIVTADNKNLLDIKDERTGLLNSYNQTKDTLDKKKQELTSEKKKAEDLKQQLDHSKDKYYNALNHTGNSDVEIAYSDAQSELSICQSSYSAAEQMAEQALSVVEQVQAEYHAALTTCNSLESSVQSAKNAYDSIRENYENQKSEIQELVESGASQESIDSAQSILESLEEQKNQAYALYSQEEEKSSSARQSLDALDEQLSNAVNAKNRADEELYAAQVNLNTAKNNYQIASNNYSAEMNSRSANSAQQSITGNEYTQLASDYAVQKNKVESLEQTIESLEQQALSEKDAVDAQMQKIRSSFESTKASILSELQTQMDQHTENLKKYEIVSTQEGVVQEVVAVTGSMVGAGSEIIKVKQGSENQKEALCYMAIGNGKKVVPGMEVMIYPTTVNKQEYGHMTGIVESVASYVTSQEEMKKRLGDDTLVQSFLSQGPVVEVTCSLAEDSDTVSGYAWSSKKGKDVYLADGTMLEASIITERKAPITMVIPLLKELFTESVSSRAEEAQ